MRRQCEEIFRSAVEKEGLALLGWRDVPGDNRCLGQIARSAEPIVRQAFHRRQRPGRRGVGAAALPGPQAGRTPRHRGVGPGGVRVLRALDVVPDDLLQGDVPGAAVVRLLSGPGRRADEDGLGRGPPAVQHEHVSELAAGPAVPHDRPQRRDQHAAGEFESLAGLRERDGLRELGRRHLGTLPHPSAGRQRFGLFRQLHGAAGSRRPLRTARLDDDDSRGVRAALPHFDGQAGVLRVSRGDHGAVGRPGGHGLHRRPPGRRHLGPQRPAALPLRGYHRRAGGAGQRGGRDRVPARADRAEGAASARPHVPGRYGRGPHRRRQRDQGQDRPPKTLSPLAGREPHRAARAVPALEADRDRSPHAGAAVAGVRLHPRRAAHGAGPDGRERPGAGRLDGDRHAAGGALQPAAAAVRLLQAAVRPGDQPADRPACGKGW